MIKRTIPLLFGLTLAVASFAIAADSAMAQTERQPQVRGDFVHE
jgi:hypothetical protein